MTSLPSASLQPAAAAQALPPLAPLSPLSPAVSLQRRWAWWTALALCAVLAWDAGGGDLPLAHWFGNSQGFALRSNWFMVKVAHEGARTLAWLVVLALAVGIWRPWGALRQLPRDRRVQLVVAALIALTVMSLMKRLSTTSCPWDLAEFGGIAPYVSHWAWGRVDGGGGHCFPAGHASAGFAFVGAYFAFAHHLPRTARRWLAGALVAGLVLGLAQQVRGAHYMSHTLWTAWLCWACGWLCDAATTALQQRRAARAGR